MHFVLKRKKHSKRKYKDLLYNSPNRKRKSKSEYNREIKVQTEIRKIKLSGKNYSNMWNCSQRMVKTKMFFWIGIRIENQKDSYIFWNREVTLEVLCFDFVTFGQNIANFPLKLGNPCCHSKHPQTMKKKLGSLKENPFYRGIFLQI